MCWVIRSGFKITLGWPNRSNLQSKSLYLDSALENDTLPSSMECNVLGLSVEASCLLLTSWLSWDSGPQRDDVRAGTAVERTH